MQLPVQNKDQHDSNDFILTGSYHRLFENMPHGFTYCRAIFNADQQVIDFEYIYVNTIYTSQGFTGVPGKRALELVSDMQQQIPLMFETLQRVMDSGKSETFEHHIPVLNKWFSVTLYSPHAGHFIGFIDNITAQKESETKIKKLNRLYAFISQINQTIVHVKDEQALFDKVCKIALEFGTFKMSWIGMLDVAAKKIRMVGECGTDPLDLELFMNVPYQNGGPQDHVVRTGTSFICNDISNDLKLSSWKPFAHARGICSCMVLPLRKNGNIIGTFNLYSAIPFFFDKEESALLEEAAADVSFALDIIEKEKQRIGIEKRIGESEANHKTIFENTSEGFVLLDTNNLIRTFNEKARKYILSNTEKEVKIGSSIYEYVEKSRYGILQAIIARVQEGETVLYERSYSIKHQADTWFSFAMVPVKENGQVKGICITAQDITEKKTAEQQRDFEQNNLSSLINNTNDLMWSVDRNFKLITSNDAFDRMVMFIAGKHIERGKSVLDSAFDAEQLSRFKSYYERAFAGETFTEIEHYRDNYSEISYYPIYSNSREIIGTACFSRDITEAKHTEEKLKRSKAHLRAANKDLETFIYRASHDLRGPLSSIIGLTNVCKIDITDPKALEYIHMIGQSTKKLDDTLIGLVQSISMKEVTKFEDRINFDTLIADTLEKFSYYEGFSTIKFTVRVSPDVTFYSSKLILQPIMQNMVENAIKYQNTNAVQSFLNITVSDTPNDVTIIFEDNGIGIDAKICDKVFDVYYKGRQESKGSGLGLYIVKTGVEQLNGKIHLESETGMGSVFTLQLPKNRVLQAIPLH